MKKQLKNIVLLILIIFLLFPIVKLTANSVDNEFYISHIQSDKYPLTEVFFSLSNSKLSGLLNDKQLRLEEDGKTIQKFELHPPRVSRKPTSTVLVIDRSLSMKDSLSKAKESVSFYINQLTNFDQLSIISFSDKVEFLIKDKNNNPTFTSNESSSYELETFSVSHCHVYRFRQPGTGSRCRQASRGRLPRQQPGRQVRSRHQ